MLTPKRKVIVIIVVQFLKINCHALQRNLWFYLILCFTLQYLLPGFPKLIAISLKIRIIMVPRSSEYKGYCFILIDCFIEFKSKVKEPHLFMSLPTTRSKLTWISVPAFHDYEGFVHLRYKFFQCSHQCISLY
jgi:hypothetical protein